MWARVNEEENNCRPAINKKFFNSIHKLVSPALAYSRRTGCYCCFLHLDVIGVEHTLEKFKISLMF